MTWGFTALAAATIYTGNKQSKAATSAANTQAAAAVESGAISKEVADKQLALQKEQFDTSTAIQKQQYADAVALQKEQYAGTKSMLEKQYNEQVARDQPWYTAGTKALADLQDTSKWALPAAFNPNDPAYAQPGAFTFTNKDFQADPGYAFRLNEGLKSLERSAAARGGLLSGGTGKALQQYGQDMASQEFQNAYNRAFTGYGTKVQQADTGFNRALTGYNADVARAETGYNRVAGLANVGQATSQQLNQLSQNYANNFAAGNQNYVNNMTNTGQNYASGVTSSGQNYANNANAALGGYGTNASNALLNAANARASGYVGSANALTNALGTGLNFYTQQQYLNRLPIPSGR